MATRCPVCHEGVLEPVEDAAGETVLRCSRYPVCRFELRPGERLEAAAARFRHPVTPGHA
ncbi:conserved protein of unknown function [Candidatus Hydrogenisulfobacillus filiaventi]|uniref:DNA topoisomerase type IA zn finger domain-containing protein n=1 Tax=Candidatus Hydrogenisulfobacillus filiaventi TaxID=2707344 RepID=A0A6F8ZH28_9FIRM|nr:hypothetical protein [Bacillota bacterium]CAB1129064.1 conserved protein of unknown function [Candidatus Hydrogenisulfobacillus filiaventi]